MNLRDHSTAFLFGKIQAWRILSEFLQSSLTVPLVRLTPGFQIHLKLHSSRNFTPIYNGGTLTVSDEAA